MGADAIMLLEKRAIGGLVIQQVRFKSHLVVVGAGWGGFRLTSDIDKEKYDVTVLSPRNHFLFTPLLPSTSVGTLEFRCVQEPVRTIKGINYCQAFATGIDFKKKEIACADVYEHYENNVKLPRSKFNLSYDKLVSAVGTKSNTFGVPGIASEEEAFDHNPTGTNLHHVFFLKQLEHARALRNRIIECFERASNNNISEAERSRLLTFLVVGGGPTSIEFASELHDFLTVDVSRWYPELTSADYCSVILVEAGKHLLGTFDESLSTYVEKLFARRNVKVLTEQSVARVEGNSVMLSSGTGVPFGVCVWSTGNTALDFVRQLGLPLSRDGRILVDAQLAVQGPQDVYAMGDCAVNPQEPLPMIAQAAKQQAVYLGKSFNKGTSHPFRFSFMGSMTQLGTWHGVMQGPSVGGIEGPKIKGIVAWAMWRSA